MGSRIELKGSYKTLAIVVVGVFLLGSWLAPAVLSSVIGSGGHSLSFLRIGYVEEHKTNLIGHWIGAAKGDHRAGPIFAFAGERIRVEHDVEIDEGKVVLRLWRYNWYVLKDIEWSTGFGKSESGVLMIDVPRTGVYQLRLSYFAFAGSVRYDWVVE